MVHIDNIDSNSNFTLGAEQWEIDYNPFKGEASENPHPGFKSFKFEEDFVEDNVRCIPMIVRFKLDACGIKLKLREWSKLRVYERNKLIDQPCVTRENIKAYRNYLQHLIIKRTGNKPTDLVIDEYPAWADLDNISVTLQQKAKEFGWEISIKQWKSLSNLQRFVLFKLCKPGHENKNFPKAMKEFGLVKFTNKK